MSRYVAPLARIAFIRSRLLSGVRHKPAVNHVPAELPLAVVEPLLGPMVADAAADETIDRKSEERRQRVFGARSKGLL